MHCGESMAKISAKDLELNERIPRKKDEIERFWDHARDSIKSHGYYATSVKIVSPKWRPPHRSTVDPKTGVISWESVVE